MTSAGNTAPASGGAAASSERAAPAPAPDAAGLADQLGLTPDELARIESALGRTPSTAELGVYSVLWSEHCSYKSSKAHLRRLPSAGAAVLAGPGENAGVVDVGEGQAVAFKLESHNHPSFVEPYQGAATGVGGIIRDVLAVGARPIALLDPLRFGEPDSATSRRVADGVVRGVGGYGNAVGVATVGGELDFHPAYTGNPLVNVCCIGVADADRLQRAQARQPGDVAVLVGKRTGRDGIGGASVLASAGFGGDDDAKRPNVQIGDPFAGKLLIEACLELYAEGLLAGVQDMGAAGIACSSAELAAAAGLGMHLDLDAVPLREPGMDAWEILCSESQERMLVLVDPDHLGTVRAVCGRWGVEATAIGEVTEGERLVCTRRGELVVDAPAASLTGAPDADRPTAAPGTVGSKGRCTDSAPDPASALEAAAAPGAESVSPPVDLAEAARSVLVSPRVASPEWVFTQYDSIVGAATVQGPGGDAAVLRLPGHEPRAGDAPSPGRATGTHAGAGRGIAVAADGNQWWCELDPKEGAKLAVAEAARNVACTGATPTALTNCLNFASPEEPAVMGAFRDTVDGLAEAAEALGTPVTGGNVSFYNATGQTAVPPTPVVGALGVLDDVAAHVPAGFTAAGDALYLVGAPTGAGLGGSEYLRRVDGSLTGPLPRIDLEQEACLHRVLVAAARDGLLQSAHDVSTGGLLVSLVESCLGGAAPARVHGARVAPEPGLAAHQCLFSESPSRVLVSVQPARSAELTAACEAQGLSWHALGTVTAEPTLEVAGCFTLGLDELGDLSKAAVPEALGVSGGRQR
jgi:phosphoribosylformylglycinamidine synthase